MRRLTLWIGSLIFSWSCLAQTTTAVEQVGFEDAIFPEIVTSARALALGNAFICRVDDSASAFYNPAGLGSVRGRPRFHLSNLHVEMNKALKEMTVGGRAQDAGSNFTKGLALDSTRELLLENRGKFAHSRFHLAPNITFRFFEAGFFYVRQTRSYLGLEDGSEFQYAERTDMGPFAALNLSLFGGIIKFGITGMLLSRTEAIGTASDTATLNLTDDDYDKGSALMMEGGFRLTLPWEFLPTFAFTVHNLSGTQFTKTGGGAAPSKRKTTIDLGFSLTPQLGDYFRVHLEMNYKDSSGAYSNIAQSRRLALGIELDIARIFYIRGGYGDGFGTGGVGIRGRNFQIDLTSYAIDATTDDFRGREERRFAFSLSAGI